MNNNLPKSLHFIGIGGCGMSPLAELAVLSNIKITGSDISENEETARLREIGIEINIGHNEDHIKNPDYLVISSAIKKDNIEVIEAKKRSIPILHRSEFLRMLMEGNSTIAVAGTHGKTTTTAMISHMLTEMDQDPSFAIGGKIPSLNSSCRKGDSNLFVAEADESDGSFLEYDPFIGIVTNIGNDHMDFYRDEAHIDDHFLKFAKKVHKDGQLILGWDDARCRQLSQSFPNNVLSFGFALGCDIRCLGFSTKNGKSMFKVVVERDLITCELPMPGKHNIQNALAALAVARALKLNIYRACESLKTFPGVQRRYEKVVSSKDLIVIDDYAHNPEKIRACIDATKESWPNHKLVVCFQPHRFTRMKSLFNEFSTAFTQCDELFVLPVYSAGEEPIEGCDVLTISNSISEASKISSTSCDKMEEAKKLMLKSQSNRTIYITIGAGDIWKLALLLREHFHEQREE